METTVMVHTEDAEKLKRAANRIAENPAEEIALEYLIIAYGMGKERGKQE